jgi:chemotaxis protein methyltransferase CheR
MRWAGFRKVRRQVCKRISRRLQDLDLPDADSYCSYLAAHPAEWSRLDSMCRITISRFYRDQQVWRDLGGRVLPELARAAQVVGTTQLTAWSVGCASGEEPFTLALLWERELAAQFPDLSFRILASDSDPHMLDRAARAIYPATTLKELPETWRQEAFNRHGRSWRLDARYRTQVTLREHDIRTDQIEGSYALILCRNLVFTYYDDDLQLELLRQMTAVLQSNGYIVVGSHERVPPGCQNIRLQRGRPYFWQKCN